MCIRDSRHGPLGRSSALDVDRGHLAKRVHACIGTSRDCQRRPPVEGANERILQHPLHGPQTRLSGPAAEAGAVVLQR